LYGRGDGTKPNPNLDDGACLTFFDKMKTHLMACFLAVAHGLGLKGNKLALSIHRKSVNNLSLGNLHHHNNGHPHGSFSSASFNENNHHQHQHHGDAAHGHFVDKVDSTVSEATVGGSSSSLLDRNELSFTEHVATALYGVGVGATFRYPPSIRIFGCYTFDGELLQFLANDSMNRLYNGISISNNRRLTGADCRHRYVCICA
jgi:hypothetical protein